MEKYPAPIPLQERKLASDALRKLFRVVLGVGVLSFAISAQGANWYVRPSSAGTANGSNWSNAWSIANLNSNWNSVAAGDTVWIAGGTYTTGIRPTKSGSSGNYIQVKRPRTTDSIPTSAAGWQASFDSQVIISPPGGVECSPLKWSGSGSQGSYMIFDGRVDRGIQFNLADFDGGSLGVFYPGAVQFAAPTNGVNHVTIANCDLAGPAPEGQPHFFHQNVSCPLSVKSYVSGYQPVTDVTISHCRLHGGPDIVLLAGGQNFVFEYCKLYDNDSASDLHPNLYEYLDSGGVTFRYCEVYNWATEGFMLYNDSRTRGPLWIYGCIFRDPIINTQYNNCCARVAEAFPNSQGGGQGPIYFFNNIVSDNIYLVFNTSNGGTWDSASVVNNNIFWNCFSESFGGLAHDYNYANKNLGETHSVNGTGALPFVNYLLRDFHITSAISSTLPRNKGVAIPAVAGQTYNTDPDGVIRGTDGTWDIGAYEYGIAGTPSPTPTATATATGTPAPTATATATATATPVSSPSPTAGPLGLSFDASAGVITAPFTVNGITVSQAIETLDPTQGGRASYTFAVPTAGDYFLSAMVNCPDEGTNSFFLNIDAEPTVAMTWHVEPLTSGFELRLATWSAWPVPPDITPQVWTLSAGTHQLIIRGREARALLQHITLGAAPRPPQGLHVAP